MSKEFEEWYYNGTKYGSCGSACYTNSFSAWQASEKATEKRVVEDVIRMVGKHTLRPEEFIKELKQKYGVEK